MANKKSHFGIIKPTIPKPQIFWGSPQEIADHLGISYRAVYLLVSGKTKSTKKGHRVMSEEEQQLYYQPPKPPTTAKTRSKDYNTKKFWLVTFVKDGKKSGRPEVGDSVEYFSGSPQDFVRFTGCNTGQVYRLINTHSGDSEKYPLKTIKGWRIARIRRYSEPPKLKDTRRTKGVTLKEVSYHEEKICKVWG